MSERVKPGDTVRIVLTDGGESIFGIRIKPIMGRVVSMPRGAGDTACIELYSPVATVEFNLNSSQFVALIKGERE